MADTVLVSTLIDKVRSRADMADTNFVTDAEIISFLNDAYRDLYNLIVLKYENYFLETEDVTTVVGTDAIPLPSDFVKLVGVDARLGSSDPWDTLDPFTFAQRNLYRTATRAADYHYNVRASNLYLAPAPLTAFYVRIYYVPTATTVTSAAQSLDLINGFAEFMTLHAAIACKDKEESDTGVLQIGLAKAEKMAIEFCAQRDASAPASVIDVHALESDNYLVNLR